MEEEDWTSVTSRVGSLTAIFNTAITGYGTNLTVIYYEGTFEEKGLTYVCVMFVCIILLFSSREMIICLKSHQLRPEPHFLVGTLILDTMVF